MSRYHVWDPWTARCLRCGRTVIDQCEAPTRCAFRFIPSTGRRALRQRERKAKKPAALRRYLRETPVGQRSGRAIAILSRERMRFEADSVLEAFRAIVSDPPLVARVNAQYYAGAMARVSGFDWFMDPDAETRARGQASPLTAGAESTGRTVTTDGWCGTRFPWDKDHE